MKDKADTKTQEFPLDPYIVYYKGKPVLRLNETLIFNQNLSPEDVEAIKQLHVERLTIEDKMKRSKKPEKLKMLFKEWTENQFALQRACGFPEDIKYHKFWEMPHCECPRLDNYDAYPTGYYVTNLGCTVHGNKDSEIV